MEKEHSNDSNDEPKRKRQKTKAKHPFLSLPIDIHAKIIGNIPVAQWPSLELLDNCFRDATLLAYRQLRNIDVERAFVIKGKNANDRSIKSILQKFVERSPFLTSLGGMHIRADGVPLLAQFEHLQSLSLGDAKFSTSQRGIPLENVVAFLESTRSRASLKQLRLVNIVRRRATPPTVLDQFAFSFANGREIQSPLKLEKFSFASSVRSLLLRLDTMDTTRLTDVRLAKAWVEPDQLTNLIERASSLRRIELSFLGCPGRICGRPRLDGNKKLLTALSAHEKLTAIKFDCIHHKDCACMTFVSEFIQMLKTIGHRGQLRHLALEKKFVEFTIGRKEKKDEMCATIRNYMPYLQSIKLHTGEISRESIVDVVSLPELEEVDLMPYSNVVTANTIEKIAQLPRLKRLALPGVACGGDVRRSLQCLGDATTLRDLRIGDAYSIDDQTFEKWADGFASNLECFMVRDVSFNEIGLIRLLEKAVRLRVLILHGLITDQSLMAIAHSCPNLETFGRLRPILSDDTISVRSLQEVVNRCPKLKRLGGFECGIKNSLQLAKYRKIVWDADVDFRNYDFDDAYD